MGNPSAPPHAAGALGATVELDGWAETYPLNTNSGGNYGIWMDKRNNPITAFVAENGFKPDSAAQGVRRSDRDEVPGVGQELAHS